MLEPIWNGNTSSVQITMAENFDVADAATSRPGRGHARRRPKPLLQVLGMVAMEPPTGGGPRSSATVSETSSSPCPRSASPTTCVANTTATASARRGRNSTTETYMRCGSRSTTGAGRACPSTSGPASHAGHRDRGTRRLQARPQLASGRSREPEAHWCFGSALTRRPHPSDGKPPMSRAARAPRHGLRRGGRRGAEAPTKSCSMRRCWVIAVTSHARMPSRRRGASCSR